MDDRSVIGRSFGENQVYMKSNLAFFLSGTCTP